MALAYFNSAGVAETRTLVSGPAVLKRITLNTLGGGTDTVVVYDNTAGSGDTVATIDLDATTSIPMTLDYDVSLDVGLTIVTNGTAADFTVVYQVL